jgi:hypothetical protein
MHKYLINNFCSIILKEAYQEFLKEKAMVDAAVAQFQAAYIPFYSFFIKGTFAEAKGYATIYRPVYERARGVWRKRKRESEAGG